MKQQLIILTTLFLLTLDSIACGCSGLNKIDLDDYERAGEIFIGQVISVKEDRDNWVKEVTFEVEEKLKPTEAESEITITTALDLAACGLSTKEGDKWYIFAHYNDQGKLTAGLCGRSVNLDKKFKIADYGLKYAYLHKRAWKKKVRRYRQEKRFIRNLKKRHDK